MVASLRLSGYAKHGGTKRDSQVGVLSTFSPSLSDASGQGSLAGTLHRPSAEKRSDLGLRRLVVRNVGRSVAQRACAAYADVVETPAQRKAASDCLAMHAWLAMRTVEFVVLCRKLPNNRINPTVNSGLGPPLPAAYAERWAS